MGNIMSTARILVPLSFISLVLSVGCFGSGGGAQPGLVHPAKLAERPAVTQVISSANLPDQTAWPLVLAALKERNVKIRLADPAREEAISEWIDVKDARCGAYPTSHALLDCRVQFDVRLQSITDRASSVTVSYHEECFDPQLFNLECPGSNAERMLLDLADGVRVMLDANTPPIK